MSPLPERPAPATLRSARRCKLRLPCGTARGTAWLHSPAACAVNGVADLETHLAHARNTGATEAQITIALSIARMVRRVATEKIELALKDSPDDGSGAGVCSGQGSPGDASASCG
jgi:hypothetical protein